MDIMDHDEKSGSFVVTDLRTFQDAIASAQLNEKTYIEVDEKIFKWFTKGKTTPYFVYGNPTIRVYLENTREAIEQDETRLLL